MASGSQPGAQALAAACGNGTALMLPPPPRPPKRKDIVLDEVSGTLLESTATELVQWLGFQV
jgi:hypothetical protein